MTNGRRFSLPKIINDKNYLMWLVGLFSFTTPLYLVTNHFHVTEPKLLPMLTVDLATPLIPITVHLYVSQYFYFIAALLTIRSTELLNRFFWGYLTMQVIANIIFVAFPTTYPRLDFPLPSKDEMDGVTFWVFNWLRNTDTPANCFPSLHVSSVFFTALIHRHTHHLKLFFFLAWSILIALSTLTTKQHYLWDVLGGANLAFILYWLFFKNYKPNHANL